MSFPVTKPVNEGDVAATLKLVLQEVVTQNKVCTVLTKWEIKGQGTPEARVVLSFDDAKCEKPPSRKAAPRSG
jgi:hypothetical protein